jgi:hypothetical protein
MKYVFLVCTEYHLLLTLNFINEIKGDDNIYTIVLRGKSKSSRISDSLNLQHFHFKWIKWIHDFTPLSKLTPDLKTDLNKIIQLQPDVFCFFQEQDMLTAFLLNKFNAKENFLFQDGMKAYNKLNRMPISLLMNEIRILKWLYINFKIRDDIFRVFSAHKYGFRNNITGIFLTFPDAYNNWNNQKIYKSPISNSKSFHNDIKKFFNWNENLIQEHDGVIFYVNQPFSYNSNIELDVIKAILERFPSKRMYIKAHPNSTSSQLHEYNQLENVLIINEKIPAELYILNLSNSIILSISSTSLFMNNPSNTFYYLRPIFEQDITRLKKYKTTSPSTHIKMIDNINYIEEPNKFK